MRRVGAILVGFVAGALLMGSQAAVADRMVAEETTAVAVPGRGHGSLAPRGLCATPKVGGVLLQWNSVAGSSGYRVYWEEEGRVTRHSNRIADLGADQLSLEIGDLVPAVLYNFRVCALRASREGPLSRQAGAKPLEELQSRPSDLAP